MAGAAVGVVELHTRRLVVGHSNTLAAAAAVGEAADAEMDVVNTDQIDRSWLFSKDVDESSYHMSIPLIWTFAAAFLHCKHVHPCF